MKCTYKFNIDMMVNITQQYMICCVFFFSSFLCHLSSFDMIPNHTSQSEQTLEYAYEHKKVN